MACHRPIVATDVDNGKWLLGDVAGHYIVKYDARDVAEKIVCSIVSEMRSHEKFRLIKLELNSQSVARSIEAIYNNILVR